MQVFLRESIRSDDFTPVTVEGDWKVRDLKKRVAEVLNIEIEAQELSIRSKLIFEDDHQEISDIPELEADCYIDVSLTSRVIAQQLLKERGIYTHCGHMIRAAWESDYNTIRLLAEAGADVNERGFRGWTALISAASISDTSMISLLNEAEAESSSPTTTGCTALMIASHSGEIEILKYLLSSNANLEVKDNNNQTALSIAISESQYECAKILINHGADVSVRLEDGTTILQGVCSSLHEELIDMLAPHPYFQSLRNQDQGPALSCIEYDYNVGLQILNKHNYIQLIPYYMYTCVRRRSVKCLRYLTESGVYPPVDLIHYTCKFHCPLRDPQERIDFSFVTCVVLLYPEHERKSTILSSQRGKTAIQIALDRKFQPLADHLLLYCNP